MDNDASWAILGGVLVVSFLYLSLLIASGLVRRRPVPPPVGPDSRFTRKIQRDLAELQSRIGGELGRDDLSFERDGFRVRIAYQGSSGSEGWTSLAITGPFVPLSLRPEATISGGDVMTGELDFDGVVSVKGDGAIAVAVLDPTARKSIKRAVLAGFTFEHEALRITTSGDDVDLIVPYIDQALGLARLLREPADLHGALLRRLQTEPLVDGRMAIAIQMPPAVAKHEGQVRELCALPEDEVRLALASRLDHAALWATLPEPTLIRLLTSPRLLVQREAIARLARSGTIASVPALSADSHWSREARDLAADAILAIQSRATGSRGDLALSSADGSLSLAHQEVEP
jgi:hypothetical protein